MLPLVEFPQLIEHYALHFETVFSEQAFIQLKRYISGLIVSELRKNSPRHQPLVRACTA